jgi:hypothetical protein
MGAWGKFIVAAAAPLMLGGCLWGPGKFTSDLAIRRDGSFTLDYRGEILFQLPDKAAEAIPWEDGFARCYPDGRTERFGSSVDEDADEEARPCTKAEIARLKAEHDKEQAEKVASKRKENEEMAKMFGIPGLDDESNRKFAERLMKYQGWKSVAYKGKGVFDVVFHQDGRLGQDFAFPLMPDSDMMIPFIVIRQRTDGSVQVTAPAFVGGQGVFAARAAMQGLPGPKGGDGPVSRAEGRFTITTDAEILTNNSEDGPVASPTGKQVRWDVTSRSNRIPEMLVRLR